jgi:hypothetical protein
MAGLNLNLPAGHRDFDSSTGHSAKGWPECRCAKRVEPGKDAGSAGETPSFAGWGSMRWASWPMGIGMEM